MLVPWNLLQTLRKLKLKISSPRAEPCEPVPVLSARPSHFNVGLYPLSATTTASEIWIRRQERPAASMGAAAQGGTEEERGERQNEREKGGGNVTPSHTLPSEAQRQGVECEAGGI